MARTIYYTATTLDGYIADEKDSLDWLFVVEGGDEVDFGEFVGRIGAMAMGRTTYEWILAYENALEEPEKWERFYGDRPAWVFTHRDLPAIPGAPIHFVQGDVAEPHRAMLEAARGKDIWIIGGGDLVGQFADAGLLDEIEVAVAPVTLGRGAPLLPRRLEASQLELVDVRRTKQFVRCKYLVRRGDGVQAG
jgi:dihydrofolate reductase